VALPAHRSRRDHARHPRRARAAWPQPAAGGPALLGPPRLSPGGRKPRGVREEGGTRCGRVRYLAGQPWPFPSSLMIGFLAEALNEEISIDPEELAEARWFSREEVREM